MTRRMSGALLGHADDESEEHGPVSKRKKSTSTTTTTTARTSTSHRHSNEVSDDEPEARLDSVHSSRERRRKSRGGERDTSSRRTSRRNSSSSQHVGGTRASAIVDESHEQDDYCLYEASSRELCSLTRPELTRLYANATGGSVVAASSLSKALLARGILRARKQLHNGKTVSGSDEDDTDSDSPRPFTSHEASPAPSSHRQLGRRRIPRTSDQSQSNERADDQQQAAGRTQRHLRTRSQSLTDVFAATTLADDPSSKPVSKRLLRPRRRSSLLEATAELDEQEVEKRLHAVLRDGGGRQSPRSRQRRVQLEALEEIDAEDNGSSMKQKTFTPIAFRTRRTTTASSPSTSPRPVRAAKSQATARMHDTVESSESSNSGAPISGDVDEADSVMRDVTPRRMPRTRRATSTATPSDADDESDDESEDEASDVEDSSCLLAHLRAPRQLRNGKVVPLIEEENEKVADEKVERAGAELDMNDDDEEQDDDVMDDNGDDVDLMTATSKTLLRYRRDDLLRLCEERGVELDGTKKELVQALLEWRETHDRVDSDDSTISSGSTISNVSVMTARAETKTEALRALPSPKLRRNHLTPLLMREGHSPSPEKPRSPERNKQDEQEEVNALDLESLQLQDKEIAPEKLTKLEKVGSGGFKDVYKGMYRKKTIAIADIRGHLTEMDIKELGLLRDLRHPNIVHFIGVSIPKEPSTVPVMIVTELCANGDLFDYIRAVSPPPFLNMLEILLGVAKGLEYLHTRTPTIIHRDIKSSNVLITANGVAKLNDFGLAKIKNSKRTMIRSLVGTVNWQAPELWVPHPRYNEKVDVYSVGLVFWEALQWHQAVKRYPFEGLNEHAIYDQVGHKNLRPSTASLRRTWGGEIVDLMSAMWDQDPAQRPPMTAVVVELERLVKVERDRVREERRRQ
ncbi:hypothetical protein OIO90_000301 [Microbotryomycetes sp. JL221]|nr:hypothetical protein OIO90_000301 [Microbotryomycetes sp. JL221]